MTTPANSLYGNDTAAILAAKIRSKFPDGIASDGRKYSQIPDDEMVQRLIQTHPTYQNWLSTSELQRINAAGHDVANDAAQQNLNELAGGMTGTKTGSAGDLYGKAKSVGRAILNSDPFDAKNGPIANVFDALQGQGESQIRAVQQREGQPTQAVAAIPFVGPQVANLIENPSFRGAGEGLRTAATFTAPEVGSNVASGAANVAGKVNAGRAALAQKVVQPLVYEGTGEAAADMRMGQNPESAITNEGLVGSKRSILGKAEQRTSQLKSAADNILQSHPNAGVPIDVNFIIDDGINRAIQAQQKVAGSTERLEALRGALKTQYGSTAGTPLEINNLKTEIQSAANNLGAYRNTQPVEASIAAAMGDIANGIKNKVNEVVPDAAPLNERMSNLMDARGGLTRNIAGDKGKTIFGGFHEGIASTVANRTVGSAPMRSGLARVLNAGNIKGVPPIRETPFVTPAPHGLLPAPSDTSGPIDLNGPFYNWNPRGPAPPNAAGSIEATGRPTDPTLLTHDRATLGQQVQVVPKGLLPAPASPPQLPERSSAPVVTPAPGYSQGVVSDAPIGYSGRLTDRLAPPAPPVLPSIEGAPSPQSSGTLPTPPPAGQNALPPLPEPQPINPQEVTDLQQETPRLMTDSRVNQYLRDRAAEQNVRAGLAGKRTDTAGNIREAHRAKLGGNKDKKR